MNAGICNRVSNSKQNVECREISEKGKKGTKEKFFGQSKMEMNEGKGDIRNYMYKMKNYRKQRITFYRRLVLIKIKQSIKKYLIFLIKVRKHKSVVGLVK